MIALTGDGRRGHRPDRGARRGPPTRPRQAPKNSVGAKQLKAKAVTTGKIANNAVKSANVVDHSLTGEDINIRALGTVPSAANADQTGNADTVTGHAAACPGGTTLIRGVCFDSSSNGPSDTL